MESSAFDGCGSPRKVDSFPQIVKEISKKIWGISMDWSESFEIIKKIITMTLAKEGKKPTIANAAALFGVKPHIYQAWTKGQRPSFDELENMARILDLSPRWLLFGTGNPQENSSSATFIPEYIEIGDTLREIVDSFPDSFLGIAKAGGISESELIKHINSFSLPSCLTVARWVHAYRLNANFLLAQIGNPFLTEAEYRAPGQLDWLRENRGDFINSNEPKKSAIQDEELNEKLTPEQRNMLTYMRIQTELGTDKERIANGIDAIVMGKADQAKSTRTDSEPPTNFGHNQIFEPDADFGSDI